MSHDTGSSKVEAAKTILMEGVERALTTLYESPMTSRKLYSLRSSRNPPG